MVFACRLWFVTTMLSHVNLITIIASPTTACHLLARPKGQGPAPNFGSGR